MEMEIGCLYFLAEHNFEFKKCFYEGLDFSKLKNFPEY